MTSLRWLLILALPIGLAAPVFSAPVFANTLASESVPLIPREVLFGNREVVGVSLSPNGERISYLAPYRGVLNLWVKELKEGSIARRLTNSTDRPAKPAGWSRDGRYLITSRDGDGDENTVLIRIDPSSGETKELTPGQGVSAYLAGVDREVPDELVIGVNDRDPRYHDLWVLNLESGERRLLHEVNDGHSVSADWIDDAWRLVIRKRIQADGGSAYDLRLPGQDGWKPFLKFSFEDGQTGSGPAGFDANGDWLYGLLNIDEDGLPRLVRWQTEELNSCEQDCPYEVVHQSASGTLGVELSDPKTEAPQVLIETDLRSRKVILDQKVANDLTALKKLAGDREFHIVGSDLESRIWLVMLYSDTHSPQYWTWNRNQQKARKLFSTQPLLDKYKLAPMESLELQARDGLRLPAYLTRSSLNKSGPQPLVLLVHGGPQARDSWGLDPQHQLLANRGYHVLSVNYRGSIGFGKRHLLAGEGQWYAAMQDDLIDAVQWAIDEGIADPDKVVIMGGSYGGYAALAGLTRDPEVFAAAVDIVGISNLQTFLASIPPYWEPELKPFERMIGVGQIDLDAISPLTYADRIERPLLISHGANDVRVKLSESEAIVSAMQSNDLPVDFIVFPDEGHGNSNPKNNLALYAVIEQFLAQHIGGRSEPIGDAIENSSMQRRSSSVEDKANDKYAE